jgi:protein ImuA
MPVRHGPRRADAALLRRLRARVRALERHPSALGRGIRTVPLGVPEIDAALPWRGFPCGALHEVIIGGGGGHGAALGFAAAVLGKLAGDGGYALWCRRDSGLYGPGLAAFGLDVRRLVVVLARSETDVLWTMEEALACAGLAAVLGEAHAVPPIALRRLQLAAEKSGVAALLVRPERAGASPAATRWRVGAAPSRPTAGFFRWQVELLRCRAGGSGLAERTAHGPREAADARPGAWPRAWILDWSHGTTGGFAVAADLRHRPAGPAVGEGRRPRLGVG